MTHYQKLHELFSQVEKYSFPYDEDKISRNGIYILFEKGEKFSSMDRVVRIGSHTGNNRLLTRINEHYLKNNHRDSIFRKHLGRCFLTKNKEYNYIEIWDLKIKSKVDKGRNFHRINWELENEYERIITKYIQDNFSFITISNIVNKDERLRLDG